MTYKELATFLKVLSDSSRLEILDLLSCLELCACALVIHFQFSQPTLSYHLKVFSNELKPTPKIKGNIYTSLIINIFESVINNLSKVHTSNQRCFCHNLKTGDANDDNFSDTHFSSNFIICIMAT